MLYIHICKYFHYHHFPNLRGNSKCTYIHRFDGRCMMGKTCIEMLTKPKFKDCFETLLCLCDIYVYIYIHIYLCYMLYIHICKYLSLPSFSQS